MDKVDILERKLLGEGGINYYRGEAEEGILGDHESRLKKHDRVIEFLFSWKGFVGFIIAFIIGLLTIYTLLKEAFHW